MQEASPPSAPPARVQEIPIRPLIVRMPGETRIIERTFVERPVERSTEPLPSIHIEVPAPAAPHITVNVERTKDEHKNVRTEVPPNHDTRREEGRTFEPEKTEVPTPPPATEVPRTLPPMESGTSAHPGQMEVKKPEVPPTKEPETSAPAQPELPTEEKSSHGKKKLPLKVPQVPEDGSSGDKMKVYSGKGRRHNDDQIDEILDEYLQYGNLPKYVSDRQRRDYRKHKRLELRRLYLEQAGLITTVHGT
jgi:hypothetical protein